MKRRRFCRLALSITAGVLLTPAVLWLLVVLVAPTNWARTHVIAALERASGRSVKLDDLDVCLNGAIDLTGLRIGAPQSVGDPWLDAPRVRIDVSVWQLLCGKFEPTYLESDRATLRVLRRGDGTLELADLVRAESAAAASSSPHRCGPSKLKATLRDARIILIDQPTQTQLVLEGVEGEGSWEGEGAFFATLSGHMNQGPFQFTVHVDHSGGQPNFEGQFRASDVVLEPGMNALRYLVPVLAGAPGQARGQMDLDIYLRGRGATRSLLCQSLVGHGHLALDPVELKGTPLLVEYARIARLPQGATVGSLQSEFEIKDGRVTTDHLTLTAGRVPVVLSGWTAFDGRLDYQVKLEGLAERVPDQARKLISGLDLDLKKLTSLRLEGTVDQVAIRSSAVGADGKSPVDGLLTPEDRQRLKVLGRQFRDKLLR
jgi:AsmA protein